MKDIALKIEHLNVNYGQLSVLSDICFEVEKGELLGIIGPNGGGKTTLLMAVLGLVPSSGRVEIFGKPLSRSDVRIGYVPQRSDVDRNFPISVIETVMTGMSGGGLHPFFRYSESDRASALDKLSMVGLSGLKDRSIAELSGGEFQRLLLARALAADPEILFLDEPTSNVDPASKAVIYDLLGELNKTTTIILVTHDLMAVSSQVKSIACLNRTLVYHGEPELTGDVVNKLYGCPVELIAHGVPHRVLHTHKGDDCSC